MNDEIDMTETLALVDELIVRMRDLDGVRANVETKSKSLNAVKADINRRMLYAAHLAKLIEADLMSHYHRFKGEDPPWLSLADGD